VNSDKATTEEIEQALAAIRTESGAGLLALAEESPVLLVFLRHFGCPFCRQMISDVADLRGELETRGVRPVFVHQGTPEVAKATFDYYRIGDAERIHDPQAAIYRHPVFMLGRLSPARQMLKPAVWLGWMKGAVRKYGIGEVQGDSAQMAGVFFLKGAKVVRKFIHRSMADQPDYLRLARLD
jgi:AhpC/TSA family